jgi:hypothetical protein
MGGTVVMNQAATNRARRLGVGVGAAVLLVGMVAGPAAASTGQSDVAVVTPSGLKVAVQPDGAPATDWTIEQVASGTVGSYAADWGTPSLYRQPTGGLVLTAVRGYDRSLWFFWQAAGAATWNPEEVAGADSTSTIVPPSIASQAVIVAGEPTETVIVAENADDQNGQPNGAVYYWAVNGTPTWHSEELPTGTGTAMSPEVTVAPNDTVVVTYITTNPANPSAVAGFGIDRMSYQATSWSSVVTVQTSTSILQESSVIEQANGNLVVSAGDVADDTYFFWSPAGSPLTWYQQSVGDGNSAGDNPTGVSTSEQQPMALTGADTGVAVAGLNGKSTCDMVYDQANGVAGWSPETIGCSSYKTLPALALNTGNHGEAAAAVDDAGNAYFYWQADGSTIWNPEEIPGISGVSADTGVGLAVD